MTLPLSFTSEAVSPEKSFSWKNRCHGAQQEVGSGEGRGGASVLEETKASESRKQVSTT